MYIGVSPGGQGGAAALPPRNLGNLEFLGSKRNLGKADFERSLHVCVRVVAFFFRREIFYCKLKSAGLTKPI